MVIKRILCAALLVAGLMSSASVCAQNSQNTTRWEGINVDNLTNNSKTDVFLYNVGTGRFLIHGGDWGTQARLFYNDSGKMLILNKRANGVLFDTGMMTLKSDGSAAKWLICNTGNWDNNDLTLTIVMDGRENQGTWTLQRVTDDPGYTYYMSQTSGGTTRWMGAAYGENDSHHDGDPNGRLALLSSSYDKAVWSTADPNNNDDECVCELKPVEGTGTVTRTMATEVQVFNADTKVPLRDLYKWRIVTKEQLLATLSPTDVGDEFI